VKEGKSNGVIFAYGQTGSGKSYTINEVLDLFEGTARVKFIQIYKGSCFDLLNRKLKIEGTEGGTVVEVDCANNGLRELVESAGRFRHEKETLMNEASSRSHSLLFVRFDKKALCLVDLAGSERVKRSNVKREGFKEATSINTSLFSLIRVINSAITSSKHIPMKDSLLTRCLHSIFAEDW